MGNSREDNDGNLYALLGLKRGAPDSEIRDAYYRLAKKYHPDGRKADAKAEEAFKAITRAAAILRDPEMRSLYDRGESGELALAAKRRAARRSSERRRIALVFLLSLTITTAMATKFWLVLLNRTSEVPNLVRNDRGAAFPTIADASTPREKSSNDDGGKAIPLPSSDPPSGAFQPQQPSSGNEKASENNAPPPMEGAVDPSRRYERPAGIGQKAASSVPGVEAPSHQNEPPSQKTASFGMPVFDTSPVYSKPPAAKLLLLRESKSKAGDCSLSRAARGILLHVSAALTNR
jgi:hypothetical protein